jgi:predicted alpha-1,2-mannosidase
VSGSDTDKRVFYTALYHSFIHPNIFNDCNGKYMGFDGVVHQLDPGRNHYENIPGWDEYRCLIPLQALLVPNETSDVAQSLVDDAIQGGGGLPRWQQTSHNSAGMVGDSPLIILATAYAYGATNFDSQAALIAMQEDASIPTTMSDGHIVRKGCDDYLTKGFIPGTGYETASSTLEYCSDDFALSRLAAALGRDKLRLQYLGQAENWKNLFNPANGYINPRNTDGSWVANFDPASQSGFVEGSSCQYTWMVPFNLGTLFQKMGGSGVAAGRLDSFFAKLNDGPGSDYAFMGNEPSFEIPWEYDWAGRPSGTQAVVRRIQDQLFNDRPNGLPGNDDGGAMSSWYVWSAIGLYPEIPGVAGFAIGSPRFTRVQIFPAGRPEIQIIARNGADGNPYVKSVHVNGQAQRTSWISCDRLSNGGNVSFDLGPSPTSWGTGADSVPPSFDAKPSVIAGAN